MKRIERDIREQFRITDRNVAIDEKRKEESLSFLQKEFSKKKAGILHSRKKNIAAAVLVYGQIHVWNPYRILYSFPGIHRVSA